MMYIIFFSLLLFSRHAHNPFYSQTFVADLQKNEIKVNTTLYSKGYYLHPDPNNSLSFYSVHPHCTSYLFIREISP